MEKEKRGKEGEGEERNTYLSSTAAHFSLSISQVVSSDRISDRIEGIKSLSFSSLITSLPFLTTLSIFS